MTVTIYRKGHFNAAHRLHVHAWSEAKNKEVFGLCNNPNYHGHNYVITLKVSGELDTESGMLINTNDLKRYIAEEVELPWDHMNLNLDVPEFSNLNPTAENIAIVAWNKLRKRLPQNISLTVILHETERNIVEYSGN